MNEFYFAKKTIIEAASLIKKYFGNIGYKLKGIANPVTLADYRSQEIIEDMIVKNFSNDSIIAEEGLFRIKDKQRIWIVDPLDGTVNFAHSFPHFSISIAFIEKGVVKFGIIYDVMRDEMFYAVDRKGAYLNSKKIKVSRVNKLSNTLLATGFAYDRAEKAEYYCSFYSHFLKKSHDIRRCGSATLDMAWVACGRIDGYWEFNLKPWDVCAGKIIVEQAGGIVSGIDGKRWETDFDSILLWGKEVVVANSAIHKQMIAELKKL